LSEVIQKQQRGLPVEGWVPSRLPREFTLIGKPINRRDANSKVTGAAKYASDINIPGMLHAKLLLCPHPHAKIKRIDTSKAESLPGVRAVLSLNNCEEWYTYWYMQKQPAFPREIAYAGQEIAAVAADDVSTATKAIELIDVEYEILPAAIDPRDALKLDAPLVPILDVEAEKTRCGNVHSASVYQRGDYQQGFMESDVIVEDEFFQPGQFHTDIGTRSCVVNWDGKLLTVHESSQGVWNIKLQLAKSLGIPEDKIRVIVKYQAGGFGSKAGAQRFVHFASKLSMMTQKPVRLELNRREEFLLHPRRFGTRTWIKIGAKKDGTLVSLQIRGEVDLGAGSRYGESSASMILHHVAEAYKCPNIFVEIAGVYTNTIPTGPQRGVMNPAGVFPMESIVDSLARKLRIDPIELRMKNYVVTADANTNTPYSSKHLDQCVDAVANGIDWRRRDQLSRTNAGRTKKRGIGMAWYVMERAGYTPFLAKAQIIIRKNGEVELRAGFVDIGTGSSTLMAMIAAEELGIDLDDLIVHYGDTEGTLYSPSSHGSRITTEMGPAVLQAAALARQEVFKLVGAKFGVKVESLASANGRIYVKSHPNIWISFKDACALMSEEEIVTTGSRAPNSEDEVYRQFGAEAAEVEVDVETGNVKVVRIVSAYDIGKALNPKLVESQYYGAITMGLGMSLFEEGEFDGKTGVLLNCDTHQYRIPCAKEMPKINTINIENSDEHYPYSGKPVGEAPLLGILPAIRNAILHATGVELNSLPMTPDKFLDAMPVDEQIAIVH